MRSADIQAGLGYGRHRDWRAVRERLYSAGLNRVVSN